MRGVFDLLGPTGLDEEEEQKNEQIDFIPAVNPTNQLYISEWCGACIVMYAKAMQSKSINLHSLRKLLGCSLFPHQVRLYVCRSIVKNMHLRPERV